MRDYDRRFSRPEERLLKEVSDPQTYGACRNPTLPQQ